MFIYDKTIIGTRLYEVRKKRGLTQAETAEKAEISDKAYAEIERGTVNMRMETLLHICDALGITPDEIFIEDDSAVTAEEIMERLNDCTPRERETALKLLSAYLGSL